MSSSDPRLVRLERAITDMYVGGAKPADRVEAFLAGWEKLTGTTVHRPPSTADWTTVRRTLSQAMVGDSAFTGFTTKVPSLRRAMHLTVQEKASFAVQARCPICDLEPDGPRVTIHVDAEPWSAQARRNRAALKANVSAALRRKGLPRNPVGDGSLCVSIAVVERPAPVSHRRDIDNTVKGLLDAMNGQLYPDDRLIDCLTVRRFTSASRRGYYLVNLSPRVAGDPDVLYDDPEQPRFA